MKSSTNIIFEVEENSIQATTEYSGKDYLYSSDISVIPVSGEKTDPFVKFELKCGFTIFDDFFAQQGFDDSSLSFAMSMPQVKILCAFLKQIIKNND